MGSSRYSWLPGWRWQSGSDRRETPRWPMPSPVPRPDVSATGAPVAFVGSALPLLDPVLGSASAIARTNRAAHFVFDWCRVAEVTLSMRTVPSHSRVHGLVAWRD